MTPARKTADVFLCAMLALAPGVAAAASDGLRSEYDRLLKRQAAAEAKAKYAESDTFVRERLGLERKLPAFAEWRAQRLHDMAYAAPPAPRPRVKATAIAAPTAAPAPVPAVASPLPPALDHGEEFVVGGPVRDAEPRPVATMTASLADAPRADTPYQPPPMASSRSIESTSGDGSLWWAQLIPLLAGAIYFSALAATFFLGTKPETGTFVRSSNRLLMAPWRAMSDVVRSLRKRTAPGVGQAGRRGDDRHPLLRE